MLRYFATLILALILGVTSSGDAQAQGSYRLKPGDTLTFQVLEDPSLNRNLLILPDGTVSVPNIGVVNASGQTLTALNQTLTQQLSPLFAQPPNVFLSVASLAPAPIQQFGPATPPEAPTIAVYALGEFAAPGRFEVEPGTTLLQFIAASGGLSRFAATKRLQLRRSPLGGPEQVYTINYRQLAAGAVRSRPIILSEGDVVIAPERRLFE